MFASLVSALFYAIPLVMLFPYVREFVLEEYENFRAYRKTQAYKQWEREFLRK